jgi:hypothetical protein
MKTLRATDAAFWALLAGLCVGMVWNPVASWAQAKAPSGSGSSGLASVSVTAPISGDGTSGSPVTCVSATGSVGGCVTTSAQTIAGAKLFSTSTQTPIELAGNIDAGTVLVTGNANVVGTLAASGITATTGNVELGPGGAGLQNGGSASYFYLRIGGSGAFIVDGTSTFGPGIVPLADNYYALGKVGQYRWANIYSMTTDGAGTTDALTASGGGYIGKGMAHGAGAPTGTDCDASGELGRQYIDTTNHRFYWCEGTTGWKYAAGT